MGSRTKRTYNLSAEAVNHVKEMAATGAHGSSQDSVVEEAIETLYRRDRERAEARMWAQAAEDPAFAEEVAAIGAVYDRDWPE